MSSLNLSCQNDVNVSKNKSSFFLLHKDFFLWNCLFNQAIVYLEMLK